MCIIDYKNKIKEDEKRPFFRGNRPFFMSIVKNLIINNNLRHI